jgi:hypothetical protein
MSEEQREFHPVVSSEPKAPEAWAALQQKE